MGKIFTLHTARSYAEQDQLEEWVHDFLLDEGDNVPFSEGLKLEPRFYLGPVMMPMNLFERCCGPEESMKYQVDPVYYDIHVEAIKKRYEEGWDMPPLIINYSEGQFELNDGNHRYESLTRSGATECPVIIWGTGEADRISFLKDYQSYYV